jgi:hypothetical protein
MTELSITLNQIRKHSPWQTVWEKLLAAKGKTQADDEPFFFLDILASNGLDDALWCLRCLGPEHVRWIRHLACDYAETVLHLVLPGETRPADAIRVARLYADGQATKEELAAARDAARAARAAAWAAWTASGAAGAARDAQAAALAAGAAADAAGAAADAAGAAPAARAARDAAEAAAEAAGVAGAAGAAAGAAADAALAALAAARDGQTELLIAAVRRWETENATGKPARQLPGGREAG